MSHACTSARVGAKRDAWSRKNNQNAGILDSPKADILFIVFSKLFSRVAFKEALVRRIVC